MKPTITIEGDELTGELLLEIPPGTGSKQIEKLLIAALVDDLHQIADDLGVVLVANPTRYARQLPGRDEAGNTRYSIRARKEGGKLVPAHNPLMYTRGVT